MCAAYVCRVCACRECLHRCMCMCETQTQRKKDTEKKWKRDRGWEHKEERQRDIQGIQKELARERQTAPSLEMEADKHPIYSPIKPWKGEIKRPDPTVEKSCQTVFKRNETFSNKKSKCSDNSHSSAILQKLCQLYLLSTHLSHKEYCAWSF